MSFLINSYGRAFIQESQCGLYEYADDCLEISGISESFGDITYIYCASENAANEYEIVAQIEGTETAPSTTITAYLPANGRSTLLSMARKKCTFNLHIHYGSCNNPTDFNDFTYGIVLEGVRVTTAGTTALTSRSPDTRSVVDLTFNVSITKVYHIYGSTIFNESIGSNTIANGRIVDVTTYDNSNCIGNTCTDDCSVLALQWRSSSYRFLRYHDNAWYNTSIISGVSTPTTFNSIIYTDGTKIYALLEEGSVINVRVLDYAEIDNPSASWSISGTISGKLTEQYHVYGGKLYFGIKNGSASALGIMTLGTGGITTVLSGAFASVPLSVFGYGSSVFITTSGAEIYKYNGGSVVEYELPFGSSEARAVFIKNVDSYKVIANGTKVFCTINGGKSWTLVNTLGTAIITDKLFSANPWHVVGYETSGSIYESYDGGSTFVRNDTLDLGLQYITSTAFCDDSIYLGSTDSTGAVGALFVNTE